MTTKSKKSTTLYNLTSLLSQARKAGFKVEASNFEVILYRPNSDLGNYFNPNLQSDLAEMAAYIAEAH